MLITGFPCFLAIKFQVIARFCLCQNGHSPGFSGRNLLPKGILRLNEHKSWAKWSQYNIEMLYIFPVLSSFHLKFLFCPGFLIFLGYIPGYFWTWTEQNQISRVSRFHCETYSKETHLENRNDHYQWVFQFIIKVLKSK